MKKRNILQIEPWIDEAELEELKRVVRSSFVVEHELTREFEERTRELTGAKHAIAVTNGTMALFCCLKALDIGPGDEVIVPDLTFIATANAVIMAGAKPVFCDVREDTLCLDTAKAERLINSRTRAIIPVHLYGQSADMEEICALARKRGLKVIEDAAQGVGVKFNQRHVGTFGELGILSYYGNKTITCGEGGVILTEDDALKTACYRLKNHGRDRKGIFVHEFIGYNFSFTEMQAAIGVSQMKKLPRIIEKKSVIHARYHEALAKHPRLKPIFIDPRCSPVHWFTSFLTRDRDSLATFLADRGVQTRLFFYPLHLQPCYKHLQSEGSPFEISHRAYSEGLSLPSSYSLSAEDQEFVISSIVEFYEHRA
jgi:perosamine synthetase